MARQLGIRIKNYRALADLQLGQVEHGKGDALPRVVCLIGPNGSGKSTLLDAFGFVADCLLEGVEAACDKPARGGFGNLRTQGETGPIVFARTVARQAGSEEEACLAPRLSPQQAKIEGPPGGGAAQRTAARAGGSS